MNHTDNELRALLAKILPETIAQHACGKYYWIGSANGFVLDTELLHLCSLVEAGLTEKEVLKYIDALHEVCGAHVQPSAVPIFATWQQRTRALAEVLGVTL